MQSQRNVECGCSLVQITGGSPISGGAPYPNPNPPPTLNSGDFNTTTIGSTDPITILNPTGSPPFIPPSVTIFPPSPASSSLSPSDWLPETPRPPFPPSSPFPPDLLPMAYITDIYAEQLCIAKEDLIEGQFAYVTIKGTVCLGTTSGTESYGIQYYYDVYIHRLGWVKLLAGQCANFEAKILAKPGDTLGFFTRTVFVNRWTLGYGAYLTIPESCLPLELATFSKTFNITETAMFIEGIMWSDPFPVEIWNAIGNYKAKVFIRGGLDDFGTVGGNFFKNNRECGQTNPDGTRIQGKITTITTPVALRDIILNNENRQIGVAYYIQSSESCGTPTALRNVTLTYRFELL